MVGFLCVCGWNLKPVGTPRNFMIFFNSKDTSKGHLKKLVIHFHNSNSCQNKSFNL